MNNNFKNDKFVEVVQEFQIVQGQSVYQIGSIDLKDVYFFVKNGNENYKVLATGQYTVDGVNLTINDPNIILTNTHIQVCRVYSTVASKYISDVVNINTLREHYNVLVDDFINVIDFLRKSGIKSDSSAMNYVFPLLEEGQVFMRKGLGFEGRQIMDINGELQLQINKAVEIFEKYLNEQKKPEIDNYIGEKETELENRLEIFTQEKIQQINDVGLKLEINQTNHGFLFDAVQYDVSRGIYIKASAAYGADGMAIRINSNKFYLVSNGLVKVPDLAVDSGGRAYVMDEFYFLDNYIAGGCTPEKPTNIFQPLFCIVDKDGIKSALIQVDTPIDLEPREITELGLPNKENTIEDLIKSRKYKVGDVVEVLGYYSVGDGSHHKRIAKAEDDGSGEQGQNGIWWCIVHGGEVNVSWFGASEDVDCSVYFKKCFDIANIVVIDANCRIDDVVFVDSKKDVELKGKKTIKSYVKKAFYFRNCENLKIRDFTLITSAINEPSTSVESAFFFEVRGCKNVELNNFKYTSEGDIKLPAPVTLWSCDYSKIINCLGENGGDNTFWVFGGKNSVVMGNQVKNQKAGRAICLQNLENFTVSNNIVVDSAGIGITVHSCRVGSVTSNIIRNMTQDTLTQTSAGVSVEPYEEYSQDEKTKADNDFYLYNNVYSRTVTVADNVVTNCHQGVIVSNSPIANYGAVVVADNQLTQLTQHGILLNNVRGVIAKSNFIDKANEAGIKITDASDIKIIGNIFKRIDEKKYGNNCVQLDSISDYVIADNFTDKSAVFTKNTVFHSNTSTLDGEQLSLTKRFDSYLSSGYNSDFNGVLEVNISKSISDTSFENIFKTKTNSITKMIAFCGSSDRNPIAGEFLIVNKSDVLTITPSNSYISSNGKYITVKGMSGYGAAFKGNFKCLG